MEGRFKLDIRKFYCEGHEALEEIFQRNSEWLVPGRIQGHVGCGFEQPGRVETLPAHSRRVRTRMIFKVPSKSNHSEIQTFSVIKLLIPITKV